jgi:hypothetical protein
MGPAGGDRVSKDGAPSSDQAHAFVGASLSLRVSHVVAGASADTAFALFGHSEGYLAGHVGWSEAVKRTRFTVLGELGQHSYSRLSNGLLSDVTSTPVALPFLGVRATADVVSGGSSSMLLGVWVGVRTDLGTATSESMGSCVWGCGPEEIGTWTVGGTTVAGGVRVGFDIGRSRAAP